MNLHMLLWQWPAGLPRDPPISGVQSLNSGKGPWVVSRIAALTELGSDHGSEALYQSFESACNRYATDPADLELLKAKLHFVTTDGAADELAAGRRMQASYPNMFFHATDECHTAMLALKKVLAADPEIEETERLLVSSKNPPSLAKWLSTSGVASSYFKEHERMDCVQVLESLSFALQRFDSRKKPLSRISMRLQQAFGALASVAESRHKHAPEAKRTLEALSGQNSSRLVLAAMLADVTWEHSYWVHSGDYNNPSPVDLQQAEERFFLRVFVIKAKILSVIFGYC